MRSLLSALALSLLALMVDVGAASSQQPGRVYRIGWLWTGERGLVLPFEQFTGSAGALREALRESGYVVGKNLVVDVRDAQGDVSQLPALAEALSAETEW